METFVRLTKGLFGSKIPDKGITWLRLFYHNISKNVYNTMSFQDCTCVQLCLHILCVLKENQNELPFDHVIINIGDLLKYYKQDNFCGVIERKQPTPVKEPEIIFEGYLPLKKKHIILIGKLTAAPRVKEPSIDANGLLYLEDNTGVIVCQVNNPRKEWLNNIVVLQKWNYVRSYFPFPVVVFLDDLVGEAWKDFSYIEADKLLICTNELGCQESVQKLVQLERPPSKLNIQGVVKGLSAVHRCRSFDQTMEPFFLAELTDSVPTVIVFQGETFAHWHHFLHVGNTYSFHGLQKTKMRMGKQVLVATKTSEFHLNVEVDIEEPRNVLLRPEGPPAKRSKYDFSSDSDEDSDEDPDLRWPYSYFPSIRRGPSEPRYYHNKVSDRKISTKTWFSDLISYQGVITDAIDLDYGVYEIDNMFRLHTYSQPCSNLACGLRVGAVVLLRNCHLSKLSEDVCVLCCCSHTVIDIVRFSPMASPFLAIIPPVSYYHGIIQNMSLVQAVKFINLIQVLLDKFDKELTREEIVGPQRVVQTSSSILAPNILSHLVDLESFKLPSRDICAEFFNDHPHSCLVSKPLCDYQMPQTRSLMQTLAQIGHRTITESVDNAVARQSNGCIFRQFTEEDFPQNFVVLGWLCRCRKTGNKLLCDDTSSVQCTGIDRAHCCTVQCTRKNIELGVFRTLETFCPYAYPMLFGAILMIKSFTFVVTKNKSNPKYYTTHLTFPWHQTDIIGWKTAYGLVPHTRELAKQIAAKKAAAKQVDPNKVTADKVASSHVASSHVASSHVASSHVASSHVASSHVASSHVASSHVASSHVASSHVASSHVASSHVASSHVASSHVASKEGVSKKGVSNKAVTSPVDIKCLEIVDFGNALRKKTILRQVAYISCHITAVQSVTLKWTCRRCNKLQDICKCGMRDFYLTASAKFIVEDCTGEAVLQVEGNHVRDILNINEKKWNILKNEGQGEVYFQRAAFTWGRKMRKSRGMAGDILHSHVQSALCRRIKVKCSQQKVDQKPGPGEEWETRTFRIKKQQYVTQHAGKVMLKASQILEQEPIGNQIEALLASL